MHRYDLRDGAEIGLGLSRVVDSARLRGGGPTPKIAPGKDMRIIHQTEMDVIDFDMVSPPIVAVPLVTCAAVVMGSMDHTAALRGVVYHALSGDISMATIGAMHRLLGGAPENLLAMYVVTNPWDRNYDNDATNLERYGIPGDNIAYIAEFPYSHFGMNNMGQIGI